MLFFSLASLQGFSTKNLGLLPTCLPPMIFTKPWVIFLISLPPGGRGTAIAVEGASV